MKKRNKNSARRVSRGNRTVSGDYYFLSNFYVAPVRFDGLLYANNEAAFQAQKCLTEDEKKLFTTLDPGEAKRLGRRVKLRPD